MHDVCTGRAEAVSVLTPSPCGRTVPALPGPDVSHFLCFCCSSSPRRYHPMHASSTMAPFPLGVPLFDTQRQYAELKNDILAALGSVCASGRFVLGPECEALEQEVAAYCGTAHGVGCASGSDALLLALMACQV